MTYSSLAFALFLPLCLLSYVFVARERRWTVIACASLAFVAVGQAAGLVFLGLATIVAYVGGLAMDGADRGPGRRATFAIGIVLLVGQLVATKYAGLSGFVPLGISFYTLRLLSYVTDVYQGRLRAERNIAVLVAYSAFFAEFLAGPVDRAGALIPQLRNPQPFDEPTSTRGLKRFSWGLLKKVAVADQLALFVNPVFAAPASYSGISLSMAAVFYAFQLYYDFSSYSDMAIGTGEMFGLRLATNFDRPYGARSIAEFWRRWHMTFSSWLRDYVFLPTAYSMSRWLEHVSMFRTATQRDYVTYAVATMTTLIVGGMWHGAGWTFVAWGALIGTYLVVARVTKKARLKFVKHSGLKAWPRFHAALQVATVFVLMDVAWVFFRAGSLPDALYILSHLGNGVGAYLSTIAATRLTAWPGNGVLDPFLVGNSVWALLQACVGVVGIETVHYAQRRLALHDVLMHWSFAVRWALYFALVVLMLAFGASESRTFIYAQF